jgi:hypothetical protein
MLAYILALMIGSGSFALYMAAFFFPEVHRKNDFIWSGVGLFYALVLWVCAGRITGGVLLGQTASVALLGWLGWQTLVLRRQVAPLDQQTPLPMADDVKASLRGLTSAEGRAGVVEQAARVLSQVKQGVQGAVAGVTSLKRSPTQSETYVPPSLEEFGTAGQEAIARFAKVAIPETETVQSSLSPVEDAIRETIPREIADTAEQSEPEMIEKLTDVTETATEAIANTVAESTQAVKQAIAPVPKQATEQATEQGSESAKGLSGLFQGLNSKNQKKESKPVYVRKQFREEAAVTPAKTGKKPSPKESQRKESKPVSKPVYVRKQFREEIAPEPEERVKEAIAEIKDADVKPPVTSSADISAAIETISEAVVSDLLGNAPVETSAAEIVEDLLEDISAQEGTLVIEATEIIEVAISPDDASGMEPITWVAELENDTANDTAIEPSSPTRAADNSEHLP